MKSSSSFYRLFFIVFFSSTIHSILIRTPEYITVYSGPKGIPEERWGVPESSELYTKYISVAQFIFSATKGSNYYYTAVQEIFTPPQLYVLSGQDIISPILFGEAVNGFFFESSTYFDELPELFVYFNCQKDGNAIIQISVSATLIHNVNGHSESVNETVDFYFTKNCQSEAHRAGFFVGKHKLNDVVNHGVVQDGWTLDSGDSIDDRQYVIDENEHSTTFAISIASASYGNQFFGVPQIVVEDDDTLDVSIRGNAQHGGVASISPETLVLLYDCKQVGSTIIEISIDLGFFGVLEFGFIKSCAVTDKENHAMPGIINVGTSRNHFEGVVSRSITNHLWDIDNPTVVVDKEELSTTFFVSTLSGKTQDILKPIVSVNPPTAFEFTITNTLRDGGEVTGNPQPFTINYICSKTTKATLTVTIKLPGFDTVDFSYIKSCKPLRKHTDHVYTANQLLVAFVICCVFIAVSVYVLYIRRNENVRKTRAGNRVI